MLRVSDFEFFPLVSVDETPGNVLRESGNQVSNEEVSLEFFQFLLEPSF